MLSIAGQDQVMLKVRIVEMDRQVIKQLGINWNAADRPGRLDPVHPRQRRHLRHQRRTAGRPDRAVASLNTTTQPEVMGFDPLTGARDLPIVCGTCTNGGSKTIATTQTTSGSNGLNQGSANIQAFEQVGLVRTLAEPNLTAVSGESAKFLVGGEFPVPVGEIDHRLGHRSTSSPSASASASRRSCCRAGASR